MSRIALRRVLAVLTSVLAVTAGLVIASGPASASYPGPWSITMVSEGEFVGQDVERFFTDANAAINVYSTYQQVGLTFEGGTYGEEFDIGFNAGTRRVLTPGWYESTGRFTDGPSTGVHGEGRGCNETAGNFEIREIAWSSTGTLQRLWAFYLQRCDNGAGALFGEVRIGMPTAAAEVEPDVARWPDLDTGAKGESVPVRVRQTGTSDISVSGTTLAGAHPQDFTIRSDQCSGQVLVEGETCIVYVRFTPKSPGPRSATLRITTDSTTLQVGLDGYASPGITDWQITSDTRGSFHYSSTVDTILYRGTKQEIRGRVDAANADYWSADIYSDGFVEGGTGTAIEVHGINTNCNGRVSSYTVDQVGFSPTTGALERLDLTFDQRCQEASGTFRGRLRYHARADITPPAQATNLSVTRTSDTTARVSWTKPATSDYAGTVVRYLAGANAPGHPTAGHLAYTGTSATAVNISGLRAGRAYTFAVFTYDTTGNVGLPRAVTIRGSTRQTAAAEWPKIAYGSSDRIKGTLTDLDGVPVANQKTRLQSRPAGATTWTTVATKSSSTGSVEFEVFPSSNREYRLVADATSAWASATSAAALVTVAQNVAARLSTNSITLGQTVTIKGSVAPNHAGRPVYLQRYYSGAWHTMKTATLSSTSTYAFSYKPGSQGTRTLRVYRPADTDHGSGISPTVTLTID